jgi:hypothetical protein
MFPSTMPDLNPVPKDSQTIEMGGVCTGDETELARMGYKQELKCVQFNLCTFGLSMFIILFCCQA